MRVRRSIWAFVCVLCVAALASAHQVHVDYDHSANFSKYRTFMWVEKPKTENSLMDDRMVASVNAQLQAKGLTESPSGADLGISMQSTIEQKQVLNTYYDYGWGGWGGWGWGYGGWGWAGPGWATTTVDTYLEGTTSVTLIDQQSERTVWQAIANGGISGKPEKTWRKNSKVIADMFEDYPPSGGRISD